MQRSTGASTARMLLAFVVFLVALVAGAAWVVLKNQNIPKMISNSKNSPVKAGQEPAKSDSARADDPFFYDKIGAAPALNADTPAPSPSTHGPKNPEVNKGGYTVEIRVMANRDEAEQLIDELHRQGIEAYYTPVTRGGRVVYRVRRGIYPSEKEAERAAMAMRSGQAVLGKVVKLQ